MDELLVGRPESMEDVSRKVHSLLEEQSMIRPAARVMPGSFALVRESCVPQRLKEGFRLVHTGLVDGYQAGGEPCVLMRIPEGG